MAMSMDNVVDAVRTPMLSRNEAPRTVPGLANASAEDASGDHLNWWQASNVQRLLEFMADENPNSEGMVLCDAPGLGKTLSVLATIERARATDPGHQLVVVFAGKGIVAQWAKQAVHHFPATNVFCAEKQAHKYAEASATVLADRERTSPGDVYVEDRPSGRLPEYDALQSFSVLILAKEMLSQNPEGTNLGRVRALKGEIRLLVVDESHNLNKKNVTKQESSVCGFDGVPRLLLSGTPGGSAAEVYRMLRLIGHTSLIRPDLAERERKQLEASRRREAAEQRRERERQQQQHNNPYAPSFNPAQATQDKYISERAWREKYFDVAAETVRDAEAGFELVELLSAVFLHTPESAAPSIAPMSIERVEPDTHEAEAYNLVLSLHQRDVLRSRSLRGQPDDWERQRPSKSWYQEKPRRADQGPAPPSAQKTIGDLMRSANGGECFSLSLPPSVNEARAPPGVLQAIRHLREECDDGMPTCAGCGLAVAGLLTLPCGCGGEVCAECFQSFKCDEFERKRTQGGGSKRCPMGCRRKQDERTVWLPQQPRLILQTDEARMLALEQKAARQAQKELRAQRDAAARAEEADGTMAQPGAARSVAAARGAEMSLRKQPPKRPTPEPPTLRVLSSLSDRQIARSARETHGAGSKLVYLAQQLRDLASEEGNRVLLTPPANVAVRSRFVEALRELIGPHSLADLNVKKADMGMQLAKFRRGYGRYWQCGGCGEDYEESTPRCSTGTCRVRLDSASNDVLRHMQDVRKVDSQDESTVFVGNRVAVFEPGKDEEVGRGVVHALGRCNHKRPADAPGAFRAAPAGSCFVLVLNPQCMEGLDLPEATHLYQVEPILREDKEKQAQARGQRLGGQRRLQIVQLLVGGTIEEQQWSNLQELRGAPDGKKRANASEHEGKQAKLLNELTLLHGEPAAATESEGEDEDEDEEVVVADLVVDMEVGDPHAETGEGRAGDSDDDALSARQAEARLAARKLLDAEDMVLMEHVSRAFQLELRKWRGKVRKAGTLAQVATQLLALRHGMLECCIGPGVAVGSPLYSRMVAATHGSDLSLEALSDLIHGLVESYERERDGEPTVEETPARPEQQHAPSGPLAAAASDGSLPQRGTKRRRGGTSTLDPSPRTTMLAVKSEQMPALTVVPPAELQTALPQWQTLAMELLRRGKVSSAAVATAVVDMANQCGETIDGYALYEEELGLDPTRVNDLMIALRPLTS